FPWSAHSVTTATTRTQLPPRGLAFQARHGRARRSGAGRRGPASEGVGGSAGAKPPGSEWSLTHSRLFPGEACLNQFSIALGKRRARFGRPIGVLRGQLELTLTQI